MDSMIFFENSLIRIYSVNEKFSEEEYNLLNDKIVKLALLFGFEYFPDQYRICIYIVDREKFNSYAKGICKNKSAFTIYGYKVFVLEYESIEKRCSREAYLKVIIHECVHILQGYYSRILPSRYVWLYETIACYLSNQNNSVFPEKTISWEIFANEFYSFSGNYGIAYLYGKYLFTHFSKSKILCVIKKPENFNNECKMLYNEMCMNLQ